MLPRLQAEETLDAATAAGLGAGTMKRHDTRRVVAALQRQAGAGHRTPRADLSTEHGRATLAMMGIAVEHAPASEPGEVA